MSPQAGKPVILTGILTTVLGAARLFAVKIACLGKLPGNIVVKKRNFSLYFPLASSLVLGIILTLLLPLFGQILGK